jgi:hypothetical protein
MSTAPNSKPIPTGFETRADARKRCARKIGILRGGNLLARQLAEKLGQCSKDDLCGSASCDIDLGYFRLSLYQESLPIFDTRLAWTRASVIPADFLVSFGKLSTINLVALNKMINKRLARSSLRNRIIFTGVDISLNVENNEVLGWQLHLYMLIEGQNSPRLQEAIKAAFPPEPTAPLPYDFDEVDDPSECVTYLFKAIFYRRSRYADANGDPRTRKQALKGPELRELILWLDQYHIGARLILRGIRRNGSRLVVINKQPKPSK